MRILKARKKVTKKEKIRKKTKRFKRKRKRPTRFHFSPSDQENSKITKIRKNNLEAFFMAKIKGI